jgi:hypothetical protein
VVNWYIFPVWVFCTKENLATLVGIYIGFINLICLSAARYNPQGAKLFYNSQLAQQPRASRFEHDCLQKDVT